MATSTLILHPYMKGEIDSRDPELRVAEARGLAEAIWLSVEDAISVPLRRIVPATYIGSGKVDEIKTTVAGRGVKLVIMDCALTPVQQRNLEKNWNCKVIDRTALILEIFGERAHTKEGELQVELAALEYQKSRLVRSWTHLERQRGGFGFLGGPGETQIEIDRRLINDRIRKIKSRLEKVKKTRGLHRKSRQKVPYQVVALVGYTNAGKSTLFNALTGAHVFAEDLLFATLDPTMRVIKLPSGRKVILSDTVGFISELPTELIAAFRATLEEVIEADLILHVRDISCADSQAQRQDVLEILKNLRPETELTENILEVQNKIDLVHKKPGKGISISALTGEGCDILLKKIDENLARGSRKVDVEINVRDGKLLAWLYRNGESVTTKTRGEKIKVSLFLSEENQARFRKMAKK